MMLLAKRLKIFQKINFSGKKGKQLNNYKDNVNYSIQGIIFPIQCSLS